MFIRFDKIHKRDGRTYRQTNSCRDRQTDIARRNRPLTCA